MTEEQGWFIKMGSTCNMLDVAKGPGAPSGELYSARRTREGKSLRVSFTNFRAIGARGARGLALPCCQRFGLLAGILGLAQDFSHCSQQLVPGKWFQQRGGRVQPGTLT